MDYPGKLIRKTPLVPTQTSASGVWTMTEAMDAVKANTWPVAGTPLPMQQSLRFRASATAYLNRTPTVASNRKTWTWSAWVKRGKLGSGQTLFYGQPDGSTVSWNGTNFYFLSDDTLRLQQGNSPNGYYTTAAVFRDPSAWYHIVLAVDTTQATAGNRVKIYVNNVLQTLSTGGTTYSQNDNTWVNLNTPQFIGIQEDSPRVAYFDGYLTEVNFVDGQQLTPSSFGRTDPITGVWQAIPYTGTYGTNGFYLPFKNPSNVGADYSGNANNWTANNFSTTPTYNYTSYTSGSGTYTVPAGVSNIQYLVVGGGGGGGGASTSAGAGGGGAGGVLMGTLAVTPGQTLSYSIGSGGAGGTAGGNNGSAGSDTTFGPFTAYGGGYGSACPQSSPSAITGGNGGSGGGASHWDNATAPGGTGVSGQGFAGGSSTSSSGERSGGGGGGAGAPGGNSNAASGGNGGVGLAWINGSYYGGGGGGNYNSGGGGSATSGGTGGGGAGANISSPAVGTAGTANTGGGGGAGAGNRAGGAGGSGIVIVAYQTSASTYDVMADVPTQWLPASTLNGNANARGNYATLNPAAPYVGYITNGNLSYSGAGAWSGCFSGFGMSSGKWYWEITVTATVDDMYMGVINTTNGVFTDYDGRATGGITLASYFATSASALFVNGTQVGSDLAGGAYKTVGDVVGISLDVDAGEIKFYKNNSLQFTRSTGISGYTWLPAFYVYAGAGVAANFGQRPFSYTPPSGFKALNTYNMSTPTILQGNTVMDVSLWTGDGTNNRAITNTAGFKPDFVWIKDRSRANEHVLFNSTTGAGYFLESQATDPEYYNSTSLQSFNSNGFTVGNSINWYVNYPVGDAFVGWQWQAGQGTTSSNTNGSITSTVNVNTSAGFSIVTYTGNGSSGATVGHGLGVAPSFIIIKVRSTTNDWPCYHTSLGNTKAQYLNLTSAAAGPNAAYWNNTTPSSSVITLGTSTDLNGNGQTFVAYCWAEIAGFSKFGSYTGNGSADGPFVYCGFQPKWLMIKVTNTTDNWYLIDTVRQTYNVIGPTLAPNLTNAEFSLTIADILSNGFKIRNSGSVLNGNGNTVIYAAFASNPFKNALAR